MYRSKRPAAANRSRALAAGAMLVLALSCLAPLPAVAASTTFRVGITIVEPVEPASLPPAVQRLHQAWPGYGERWAEARRQAASDPLGAVRQLREVHAAMRGQPGWQAWEADMADAGQALFRAGQDGQAPGGAGPGAGAQAG